MHAEGITLTIKLNLKLNLKPSLRDYSVCNYTADIAANNVNKEINI